MWYYKGKEFKTEDIGDHIGFVYLITNLTNGKKYIGKKLFRFKKTKKIKGKVRKQRTLKESDWGSYYSSSNTLRLDVDTLGKENFKREIFHLCKSKGTANYLEMKEQILHGALESDWYYNDQIHVRVHRSHIKLDN